MRIDLPDPSLVVLIGPSGCGKSSFARAHFAPTEVISSDFCRGLVADDENDQAATSDAFAVLHFIAGRRLAQPRFTVVDATNVQREARRPLIELAKQHDLFPVAIVLDMPEAICQERNRARPDRDFGPHVVRNQRSQLHKSLKGLRREGFRRVWVLRSPDEVEAAEVERAPLWTDRRSERGPFDVIGDIHGCYAELTELLRELGYAVAADGVEVTPPDGRRAIFVGDYGDRGPDTPAVLKLVMSMAEAGTAICLPGNHDIKLVRKLKGRDVQITHGLAETLDQLESESDEFRDEIRDFLDKLVSHVVLDDGKLVVAHAGMKQAYQGRSSGRVRDFALFGETTGETDEFGLPVRLQWASEYRGERIGRVRPHAGRGARLGQQHDQHRHRVRVRWPAYRAAVARARAGLGAGRAARTTNPRSRSCRPRTPLRPSMRTDRRSCSTSTTSPANGSSRPPSRAT